MSCRRPTADEVSYVSVSQSETPDRWFVQLQGKAKVQGASAAEVAAEKQAFRDAAKAAGVTFKERFAYDTLWNGFSVQVDGANLAALRSVPGVKAVFPVVLVDGPPRSANDGESSIDLATAVTQTGVDLARSQLGLTGKGVKVAIIDTGIDYDHPDLGGGFGPGYKVAYGYDLVGDALRRGAAPATRWSRSPTTIRTTARATARTLPASSAPRRPPPPA